MASAGMVTVTNSFENKTPEALATISPNLIAAEPRFEAVADALGAGGGRRRGRRAPRARQRRAWSRDGTPPWTMHCSPASRVGSLRDAQRSPQISTVPPDGHAATSCHGRVPRSRGIRRLAGCPPRPSGEPESHPRSAAPRPLPSRAEPRSWRPPRAGGAYPGWVRLAADITAPGGRGTHDPRLVTAPEAEPTTFGAVPPGCAASGRGRVPRRRRAFEHDDGDITPVVLGTVASTIWPAAGNPPRGRAPPRGTPRR